MSEPEHNWRYVDQLPIYKRIGDIVKLTIKATEQQLKADRRKLRKMQYGA